MSETETNVIKYKQPGRTSKGVKQRQVPDIIYNDRDVKAYQDLDLEVPEHVGRWEKRFLSLVDVSRGPIERSVYAMVRLKAPDYLAQEKDKLKVPERKEFIYFLEEWRGLDFRGVPLNPVMEHIEGKYDKQFTRLHFNQETGEIDYYQLDSTKAQTIYYIPYSKKAVDDIIAKSAKTDKDNGITFTIKFGTQDNPFGQYQQMPSRNQFSYQQFSSWSWTEICKLQFKPTVQAYEEWIAKEKAKDGLSFDPS